MGRLEEGTAEALRAAIVAVSAVFGLFLLAVLDHHTGAELGFSIFYAVPVIAAAWHCGRLLGVTIAMFAMLLWLVVDLQGSEYSHPVYYYWNAFVRGGLLGSIAYLVARVRSLLDREAALANTDSLTKLANARGFTASLAAEITRSRRTGRPFALVYLDLDDFKRVNDMRGHLAGDAVLRSVAELLQARLRRTDLAARLGGDEFALLLRESDPEGSQHIIRELHAAVQAQLSDDPSGVGASVGMVCFCSPPDSAEAAIHEADSLMYEVKMAGKGAVRCRIVGQGFTPLETAPAGQVDPSLPKSGGVM